MGETFQIFYLDLIVQGGFKVVSPVWAKKKKKDEIEETTRE